MRVKSFIVLVPGSFRMGEVRLTLRKGSTLALTEEDSKPVEREEKII